MVYLSRVLLCVSFFFGCLSTANARLVDFEEPDLPIVQHDFPFGNISQQFVHDLGNGLTLTMTAFIITGNDGDGNISSRTQLDNIDGVYFGSSGVKIPSYQENSSDDSDLDGASHGQNGTDYDEGILFSFNKIVELKRLNFGSFGSSDDFNLEVDGVNLMHDIGSFDTHALIKSTPQDDYFNFQNIFGKEFLVWADGDSDDFRIDDITFDVPEPATIPLMLFALSTFVFVRRKYS